MAFVLQSKQSRDNEAVHLKLDQLLGHLRESAGPKHAAPSLSVLESLSETEFQKLEAQIQQIAARRLHDAYDDQGPTRVLERSSVTRRIG